jgi:hypothetical protein
MWNRRRGAVLLFAACALTTCQRAATLRFASPADGAVVYSGPTFVVTVEASPGVFKQVAVIGTGRPAMSELRYVPPYRFTRRVPPTTSSGAYYVTAIGVTRSDERVESQIEVDVERLDPPVRKRNPALPHPHLRASTAPHSSVQTPPGRYATLQAPGSAMTARLDVTYLLRPGPFSVRLALRVRLMAGHVIPTARSSSTRGARASTSPTFRMASSLHSSRANLRCR